VNVFFFEGESHEDKPPWILAMQRYLAPRAGERLSNLGAADWANFAVAGLPETSTSILSAFAAVSFAA
jgi:hypothetical protein